MSLQLKNDGVHFLGQYIEYYYDGGVQLAGVLTL